MLGKSVNRAGSVIGCPTSLTHWRNVRVHGSGSSSRCTRKSAGRDCYSVNLRLQLWGSDDVLIIHYMETVVLAETEVQREL